MADLNSWEDDPAAQDDNLSRQTQQLNLGGGGQQQQGQGGSFRPGAASFQPGAASFQPGQPYGYMPQYQPPQQYYGGQGYYPQYGGPPQVYGQYGQGGYGQGYSEWSQFRQSHVGRNGRS